MDKKSIVVVILVLLVLTVVFSTQRINFQDNQSLLASVNSPLKQFIEFVKGAPPHSSKLSRDLQVGNFGEDVILLQRYLASEPGIYPGGLIDGRFGPMTRLALRRFQSSVGILPTGRLDLETRTVINDDIDAKVFNASVRPNLGIKKDTINVLNLVNELRKAPNDRKAEVANRLKETVAARRDYFLETIRTNPNLALETAIPSDFVSQMPSDVRELIEQRRPVTGTFEYIYVDFDMSNNGYHEELFYINEDSTGERYQVFLEGRPSVLTDDTVTIDGVVLGNAIATKSGLIKKNSTAMDIREERSFLNRLTGLFRAQTAEAQSSINLRKTAVILVDFQGDTRTPLSPELVRANIFTSQDSVNAYYQEASFGKIGFTGKNSNDGDIFSGVTIPYDGSNCDGMYNTWSSSAESILQSQGVDLSGYNNKIYMFPSVSCWWAGRGTLGGNPARSWIIGDHTGVIAHELGHNLTAHHASSWRCTEGGSRVSISTDANCSLSEYGDYFSVMGSIYNGMRHLTNFNKSQTTGSSLMNWLSSENTLTIDRNNSPDATYTIAPIETSSSGIQSLRIPRTVSTTGSVIDYYYLEFRQPIGFDSAIYSTATNGVSIRIGGNHNKIDRTKLVDATPETTSFLDAPLAVGKTFTDPYIDMSITTLATSSAGADVRVFFGGGGGSNCVQSSPSLSLSPTSTSVYSGQSASFSYTLTNNDSFECGPSTFSVTPNLPSGFSQSPSSMSHSLSAGSSISGTVIVTTSTNVSSGNYTVTETAVNSSNGYQKSTSSTIYILASNDTTPPVVTIDDPIDGSSFSGKGNVDIMASATDDSGIAEIRISVSGSVLKTCFDITICNAKMNIGKMKPGSYTVTAEAIDTAGPVANYASTSINITIDESSGGGGGKGGGGGGEGENPPPPPEDDFTPPTVTVTSPSNGEIISRGNTKIEVAASDESGIAEIKIFFNSSLLDTCSNSTSCSSSVHANSLSSGTYTISAEATDYASNKASTSILITKD